MKLIVSFPSAYFKISIRDTEIGCIYHNPSNGSYLIRVDDIHCVIIQKTMSIYTIDDAMMYVSGTHLWRKFDGSLTLENT